MARQTEPRSFPFLTVFIVLGLAAYAVFHLREVLAPFFLSVALAYLINPLINWMERYLRRGRGHPFISSWPGDHRHGPAGPPRHQEEFVELKANLPVTSTTDRPPCQDPDPYLPSHRAQGRQGLHGQDLEPSSSIQNSLLPPGPLPVPLPVLPHPFITFFLLLDWHNILSGFIQFARAAREQTFTSSPRSTSWQYPRYAMIVVAVVPWPPSSA